MGEFKNSQLISFGEVEKQLLKKKGFRDAYYRKDQDFDVAKQIIMARVSQGLTQKELAKRIGTKQPSIARLESGLYSSSLKMLRAVADALHLDLDIRFSNMSGI